MGGPLVLVAKIGLPKVGAVQPSDTVIGEMLRGTGLRAAFDTQTRNSTKLLVPVGGETQPNQPVLQGSYLFYRDVELEGKWVHTHRECSRHVLMAASFRQKAAGLSDGVLPEGSGLQPL